MKHKPWTPEEIDTLKALFHTRYIREIASLLGRSYQAVALKACKLHLKKNVHPDKIIIASAEIEWLKCNYPHLINRLLCMRLGISEATLHRLARKYRLKKSPQFMRDCQAFTARKAHESHIRNGTYPQKGYYSPNLQKGQKYQFKPGHKPLTRCRPGNP